MTKILLGKPTQIVMEVLGMCCGYASMVGQELKPLDELEEELSGLELKEVEEAINMNTGPI